MTPELRAFLAAVAQRGKLVIGFADIDISGDTVHLVFGIDGDCNTDSVSTKEAGHEA